MLHQHITRALLALFLTTLFLSGAVSYFAIKSDNIDHYRNNLESHIKILVRELPQINDLDSFAKRFRESTDIRFTLINEEGMVVTDSDHDSETMDNHSHREEMIKAGKASFGYSIRFSDTIKSNFLYVAHRFSITIIFTFYDWQKISILLCIISMLYGLKLPLSLLLQF